ncbi:monooxygenase [Roseibium sp.]|uniref:monooxygenase n=1 Tax=Roseibium sp. TaxID=1936156 RepID=UPI003D0B82B1
MPVVFQVDFPFNGPWGEDLAAAMADLSADIAGEPGLIWKIWTENPDTGRAGGVYLFETGEAARNYAAKHLERLEAFGVSGIVHHQFQINESLSGITRFTGKG